VAEVSVSLSFQLVGSCLAFLAGGSIISTSGLGRLFSNVDVTSG